MRPLALILALAAPLAADAADPPTRQVPDLDTPSTIAPGQIDPAPPSAATPREARRRALDRRAADPLGSQQRHCQLPDRRFEPCR